MDIKPSARTIHRDLACLHCRYNLRGLEAGGCCPECNAPISDRAHLQSREERIRELRAACRKKRMPPPVKVAALMFVVSFVTLLLILANLPAPSGARGLFAGSTVIMQSLYSISVLSAAVCSTTVVIWYYAKDPYRPWYQDMMFAACFLGTFVFLSVFLILLG